MCVQYSANRTRLPRRSSRVHLVSRGSGAWVRQVKVCCTWPDQLGVLLQDALA